MKRLILFASLILALTSCANIYKSVDCYSAAQSHKKIAIVPPTTELQFSPRGPVDQKALAASLSSETHQNMLTRMLKLKAKAFKQIEIQEPQKTVQLIKASGKSLESVSNADLCKLLNVDALVYSNYYFSKPFNTGTALVVYLLTWTVLLPTNQVNMIMKIYDPKVDNNIWSYEHKFSGTIGSSPSSVMNTAVKKSTKKMPYFEK